MNTGTSLAAPRGLIMLLALGLLGLFGAGQAQAQVYQADGTSGMVVFEAEGAFETTAVEGEDNYTCNGSWDEVTPAGASGTALQLLPNDDDRHPFGGIAEDGTYELIGVPQTIPGVIQAEFFDTGGAGVAYQDSDPNNNAVVDGGQATYRLGSVEVGTGGLNDTLNVGWTVDGEWLEYTVNVTPGTYDITAIAASGAGSADDVGNLMVMLDGDEVASLDIGWSGDWGVYEEYTTEDVEITTEGTATLRLQFDGAGFNLDAVAFEADGGGKNAGIQTTTTACGPSATYLFEVPAARAGEDYYLHVRRLAESVADNSVWVMINGDLLTSPFDDQDPSADLTWVTGTSFAVKEGVNVLSFFAREDGYAMDKIVLTPDASATVDGAGPDASSSTEAMTTAILAADSYAGFVPATITFDASASIAAAGATITSYDWDFDGDGTVDETTTDPQVTHEYTEGGAAPFMVSVTVTDSDGGTSTATREVSIVSSPQVTLNAAASGPDVELSWTPFAGVLSGYRVYASVDGPITDITSEGVYLVREIDGGDASELEQRLRVAHPDLADLTVYYAVTGIDAETDEEYEEIVDSNSGAVQLEAAISPFIFELTAEEAQTIASNLTDPTAPFSLEGWPIVANDGADQFPPFVLNEASSSIHGDGVAPDGDDDLSGQVWFGYSKAAIGSPAIFMYAEVTDDVFIPVDIPTFSGSQWQYDTIEFYLAFHEARLPFHGAAGIPAYVRAETGNEHEQVMASPRFTGDTFEDVLLRGQQSGVDVVVGGAEPQGGYKFEMMTDGEGNEVGFRYMAVFLLNAFNPASTFELPDSDEVLPVPFDVQLDDADTAGGTRDAQISYWEGYNYELNQAWNNPSTWGTSAYVGRDKATGLCDPNHTDNANCSQLVVDTEEETAVPTELALEQNFPNPVRGLTNIRFVLDEPREVSLSVYNMLGQKVATLVDGELRAAGPHNVAFSPGDLAAGVYLYQLVADGRVETRRMVLLK